jgi:aminotransferase
MSGERMKPLSDIVKSMPASGIRRFFDIVSTMKDVVSLGVGEPDFPTPWRVREAAIRSLERGITSYTSNYGMIELRREVAKYLRRREGLEYNPENQILITVGVSEGMDLAMRAILNQGDEVIVPEPCYVSYKPCIQLAGGVPVPVRAKAEAGFRATPEQIAAEVTPRTKLILLSYPSNPTGAISTREDLEGIVRVACEHDLYIITDEIYDRLTYEGKHVSVPTLPGACERTIYLNGFSKAYAMTGWRMAYACGDAEIIELMMKIHQYTMLSAPTVAQYAAIEALKNADSDCEEMVGQYRLRRNVIVKGMNDIGLDCLMPGGAFYVFPSIAGTGLSSDEFCERLLFEEKVAVVPGNAFGECGEGHVRCCYAASMERIEEALRRTGRFVSKVRAERAAAAAIG